VQRQPDPLQPDDQHELQAAAGDRNDQASDVARRERPNPEQGEPEHRVGDPALDHGEGREQQDAADDAPVDERVCPAHRVAAVGLDARGDADQDRGQADGERDVAPPVDFPAMPLTVVAELEVCADSAVDTDRNIHPEHGPPVDGRQGCLPRPGR
jgi:hypothetical protein